MLGSGEQSGQGEAYSKNLCACAATQPTECRSGAFTCQLATCQPEGLHNQIQFFSHFSALFQKYMNLLETITAYEIKDHLSKSLGSLSRFAQRLLRLVVAVCQPLNSYLYSLYGEPFTARITV